MRIEALTAEERGREIAQLLGRALRRVLERTKREAGALPKVDASEGAPLPGEAHVSREANRDGRPQ